MVKDVLLNVFVYLPAALFYVIIGAYIWSKSEKK